MTSRQRLLAAMRFEKVDRIPVAPFTLGRLPPDSAIAAELIEKTDPFITTGEAGDVFFGAACESEVVQEGDTTTIVRHTPLGDLIQRNRSTDITSACVEFPVKTLEDVERLRAIPYAQPAVDVSLFMKLRADIGEQGMVLCGLPDAVLFPAIILSPTDFSLWWADYPDLMIEITNTASCRLLDRVRGLCEAGVDAFRIVGGEYASVQLGPAGFDALVLEQDRELVDLIHSYGGIAYYHNHGPMMKFLDRFAHIGMDALDPMEAPPWGDADLAAARKVLGEQVPFVGNLDDMEILEKLDESEVIRIASERMEAGGKRGFILGGTASGTYAERAARNFIALAEYVAAKL